MAFLTDEFNFKWLLDGKKMELLNEMQYKRESTGKIYVLNKGFRTDGSSIPKFFWSFTNAPFVGKHKFAALIHDWLCHTKIVSRKEADEIFKEALVEYGVKRFTVNYMYQAVKGWSKVLKIFKKIRYNNYEI